MKKILVPTDFSKYSMFAAELAAKIAKKTEARVYFIHLINFPTYAGNQLFQDYQNVAENLFIMKYVRQKFKELFKEPFLQGVNVAEVVSFHSVNEAITELAEKNGIDLIVMGTHGSEGFMEKVVGSTTEKIVSLSNIPVITCKNKMVDGDFENLVFAYDNSTGLDKAFSTVKDIADVFGSKINLLRVVTPGNFESTEKAKRDMDEFAKSVQLKSYESHVYNAFEVEDGIINFGKSLGAGVLATANNGKSTFARIFNTSVTRELIVKSDLPVLTVKL